MSSPKKQKKKKKKKKKKEEERREKKRKIQILKLDALDFKTSLDELLKALNAPLSTVKIQERNRAEVPTREV